MKKIEMIPSIALALIMGAGSVLAAPSAESGKIDGMAAVGDKPIHSYYGYSDTPPNPKVAKALEAHKKMMAQAPKAVLAALDETTDALRALEKHDTKTAQKLLDRASAAFSKAIEENPALKRVPVADDIAVEEIAATPGQIEQAIDMAKEALAHHRLSEARGLLMPLRDEVVVATQYLPMDLYPSATKLAAKLLRSGHEKEALQTLTSALGTLETEEVIVPMPLVRAEALVEEASKLDRSKKQEAKKLLGAASDELKKAVLLGYSDKQDKAYTSLEKQIEAIESAIDGKNEVEKLYDKVKTSFESLFRDTQAPKDSVAAKEADAIAHPSSVKAEAAARARVEEAQAKELFEAKEKISVFKKASLKDEKE